MMRSDTVKKLSPLLNRKELLLFLMNKVSSEPLTDEMLCELAADAMYDVMVYGMNVGYVTLQDIHLAIGRAVEQAHGIGVKQ